MARKFTHGYTLLVGVGQSAYSQWSLPVAVKDVQAIRTVLTDPNLCAYPDDDQHVRLLCDAGATHAAIMDGLEWLKSRASGDPEATIVVYYSGHGWVSESAGYYYLIPHDINPYDVPGSALAAAIFACALREIPAQRLVVFIDSCHAQGMATAKNAPSSKPPSGFDEGAVPKALTDILKQGEGRAVFTSSRGRQLSWIRPDEAMSIYTYHLVEALRGAGNHPGDAFVRVSDLMNYLAKTVPDSVAGLCPSLPENTRKLCELGQTPFFDYATEDFPVAMLRGGKGLPSGGWESVAHETNEQTAPLVQVNVDKRSGGVYIEGQNSVKIEGDVIGRGQTKRNH